MKVEIRLTNETTNRMNALYGATANRYFAYYIPEMAEAITTSGQLSIRWAAAAVNDYLNKVMGNTQPIDFIIYMDTDSLYVSNADLIEKFFGKGVTPDRHKAEKLLDEFYAKKVEPVLAKAYAELAERMGAFENAMSMKREKINDLAVFCGKKRYILNTLNSEGVHYPTPKISVTGIESVRSSTPRVVRKKMEEMFKILMKQDERAAQDFIAEFYEEFQQMPLADIAKNSGIEDVTKSDPKLADLVTKSNHNGLMWDGEDYVEMDNSAHGAGVGVIYVKGTPIHVRGALLFNHHIKRLGLENKYEPIQSGDKIQFVYLKLPNPIGENVISFFGDIPAELGLSNYVDYQTQFEKVFLHPMKNIMSSVGWTPEKVSTLDDFFS